VNLAPPPSFKEERDLVISSRPLEASAFEQLSLDMERGRSHSLMTS